jgi:hypothetical protein
VAVLGHTGMLGSVVARYFAEQGADVATTELRWFPVYPSRIVDWAAGHDLTINCIRGELVDNALLPLVLGERCRLIQPSTDAVFEDTPYAIGKRIGERANALVIRSGIVDVDRQPDTAYANWLCNPVTPLEWAEQAWRWRYEPPGVRPYGRGVVSRWDVACAVAATFGRKPPKVSVAGEAINRVTEPHNLPQLGEALETFRRWLA